MRISGTSAIYSTKLSTHPLAREGRFQLVLLGFQLVREGRLPQRMQAALQLASYKFALSWYARPPTYINSEFSLNHSVTFGNNRIQSITDAHLLASLAAGIDRDPETGQDIRDIKRLLQILLKDETFRLHTWISPLAPDPHVGPVFLEETSWLTAVQVAWNVDPYIAVHLSERFISASMMKEIRRLILANPESVIDSPLAAQIMLGDSLASDLAFQMRVFSIAALIDCSICYSGHQLFRLRPSHTSFRRLALIR